MTELTDLQKYEFRRSLEEGRKLSGRGTELISLYVPPSRQISDVANYLRSEYSQSSNIKSDSTRKTVQSAISSILSRLKNFKEAPHENGLVFFVGHRSIGADQTNMIQFVLEPPESRHSSTGATQQFFTEPIEGMLETKEKYGLIVIDRNMGTTIDAITSLATQLRDITAVMEKTRNLDRTLGNFRHTSEELKLAVSENRTMLKETVSNLHAASRTAKALTTDREAQLRRTLDSFERSAAGMERLTAELDSLRAVVQSVSSKVDSGQGSLGRLVNDPKLYEDAKASVAQLRLLIEDIKKNPKKYINLRVF